MPMGEYDLKPQKKPGFNFGDISKPKFRDQEAFHESVKNKV